MPPTGTVNFGASSINDLYIEPATDPTGGGHPCGQLVARKADGTIARSALYIFEHNTAGLKAFTGNGSDASVFEVDANGRIVVQTP